MVTMKRTINSKVLLIMLSLACTLPKAGTGQEDKAVVKGIAIDLTNHAISQGAAKVKQKAKEGDLPEWLTRTDININVQEHGSPNISIETIQPIRETELGTAFWQGRIASDKEDQTINLGVGYRRLNKSKTWLFGVNSFYDQTIKNNHQRIGLGFEAFNPYTTARANYYHALSDLKSTASSNGVNQLEKAQDGWDLSLEAPIPYVPWANINYKHYEWKSDINDDTRGESLSIRMFPKDNLEIEIGAQNDNTDNTKSFANLTWYFDRPSHSPSRSSGRKAFSPRDITKHRLEKVRRHNDIKVERVQVRTAGITISRGS